MFFFFFIDNVQIKLGASPKEADVAIVSIDSNGTVGELNQFVLNQFGYDKSILKQLKLGKGFDFFQLNGKPILFVVTVGIGNPLNNLNDNLRQAITNNFEYLKNKKIWIPLMGTGAGNLSYDESYKITTSILEGLKDFILKFNCEFIISVPEDKKGEAFYKKIDKLNSDYNKPTKDNVLINVREVNSLLNYLNANYYFVGIDWEGKNQTERFYEEGIWETGFIERLTGIIKNILVDDILFIKEPIKINNVDYFKIKAIGKVTNNPLDGKKVKVNWIVKNINIEIETLGYNDSTITTAHLENVREIFSKINKDNYQKIKSSINLGKKKMYKIGDELENDISTPISTSNEEIKNSENNTKSNITTLAGLISDTEAETDYLEISKDVNAFARVMAAKSFEPPLAIALLGKWGSGKSFFMRKLKENIQTLSTKNPEKQFCEGIAHVHFNAWSYMDANLWASIVTRIFEGLNEYISGDSLATKNKKEIEKKLTQNLNIAKEEIATLKKQNENINAQIQKLNNEKELAEQNLKDKIESIRTSTIKAIIKKVDNEFKVNEQIDSALAYNETFINSTNRLKKIVPEQYWINPNELYKQLKSKYTFLKTFFYGENWWKNCLWLAAFLIIVLYTPIFTFIASLLLSWQDFTLTPITWTFLTIVGTALVRGIDTYKKLKTLIAPFWKIKENYEAEKDNALFEFHQKEKALKLEIENGNNEINVINEQINKAIVIKASIEFKLENALSTEALYLFIERRANSEDYKKHLGIVSIIRKDFEVLSDLLVDHKEETSKNSESEKFNAMFNKPLERIILYIDDLDRCPEERVVEVLEAVNLLMAFPLFVVVVGVDPRWVKTALQKKYKNQFTEDKENKDAVSPSNYLEKIFQVPFHLKDADDESIKRMIKTLAQIKPNLVITESEGDYDPNDFDSGDFNTGSIDEKPTNEEIEEVSKLESTTSILNKETIEALNITEKESELLQNMSKIIGNNPRAVKRFVNIYRIVKTHENFGFNNEETKEAEMAVIMFLLALPMGKYKNLIPSLENFLIDNTTLGHETLDGFLNSDHLTESYRDEDLLQDKRKEVYNLLFNNIDLLSQNAHLLKLHYQFIKRFTFKNT